VEEKALMAKHVAFFVLPSNILILLGLAGAALLLTRFARAGRIVAAGSLFLFAVAGFSPLSNALLGVLEDRFPPWDASRGDPAGVIVLGGAITPDVSAARRETALNEAAERVTAAVVLARRYPSARIVYSGGDPGLLSAGAGAVAVEAEWAAQLFDRLGLPRERVLLELRSRNTADNASFTKEMVAPEAGERWLLVTSAAHMPRAIGAFRRVGFLVEAHPVDWRTRGRKDATVWFGIFSAGLARMDGAVHEWLGLLAYWISGRSSALFPSP
jgi:uncharacterized SAM-binding protein YcdF (DUF218 family)